MKNIIYVSLIATLLVGCKGNSFLTQRYTKYGHSPIAAKSETRKIEKRKAITESEAIATAVVDPNADEVAPQEKTEDFKLQSLYKVGKEKAVRFVNGGKHAEETVTNERLNENTLVKDNNLKLTKKSLDKKTSHASHAKAIIGKVLKIIILILLLAVVGAIIFLVTLVSAL